MKVTHLIVLVLLLLAVPLTEHSSWLPLPKEDPTIPFLVLMVALVITACMATATALERRAR